MENVHVLTHKTVNNGEFMPYRHLHNGEKGQQHTHNLMTELQKTLELNELLNYFEYSKYLFQIDYLVWLIQDIDIRFLYAI